MKPVTFQCSHLIPRSAAEICSAAADTDLWSSFKGYGILPGIEKASYDKRTEDMLGSRIRVRSTDGSEYIEEIYKWVPGKEIGMRFCEFTPPLSNLASHFTEEWTLVEKNNATQVTRSFQMFPKQAAARPVLWLISLFFRRAIQLQLAQMAALA